MQPQWGPSGVNPKPSRWPQPAGLCFLIHTMRTFQMPPEPGAWTQEGRSCSHCGSHPPDHTRVHLSSGFTTSTAWALLTDHTVGAHQRCVVPT